MEPGPRVCSGGMEPGPWVMNCGMGNRALPPPTAAAYDINWCGGREGREEE